MIRLLETRGGLQRETLVPQDPTDAKYERRGGLRKVVSATSMWHHLQNKHRVHPEPAESLPRREKQNDVAKGATESD